MQNFPFISFGPIGAENDHNDPVLIFIALTESIVKIVDSKQEDFTALWAVNRFYLSCGQQNGPRSLFSRFLFQISLLNIKKFAGIGFEPMTSRL